MTDRKHFANLTEHGIYKLIVSEYKFIKVLPDKKMSLEELLGGTKPLEAEE